MTASTADRRPSETARSGRWIPWMFVLGFAIIVAANGTMVWVALSTFTGLETRNHYREGLAFNERIADARRQERLGWSADVRFDAPAVGVATIEVDMTDAAGRPLRGASVEATVVRPTHTGHDVTFALDEVGAGRYRRQVDLPRAGQWELRLLAQRDGQEYRRIERVFVRP